MTRNDLIGYGFGVWFIIAALMIILGFVTATTVPETQINGTWFTGSLVTQTFSNSSYTTTINGHVVQMLAQPPATGPIVYDQFAWWVGVIGVLVMMTWVVAITIVVKKGK